MRVRVALGVGLVSMAILIGVVLTRSPPLVAGSDFTPLDRTFARMASGGHACQAHEGLPAGVSAVRLSLYAPFGPRLTVKLLSGRRIVATGMRGNGWIGESPTVPLRSQTKSASDVTVCFEIGRMVGRVGLDGKPAAGNTGPVVLAPKQVLPGRMRIEFLRAGGRSWFSLIPSVARRAGLGRWPAGTWTFLLAVALVATVATGACWLTLREL